HAAEADAEYSDLAQLRLPLDPVQNPLVVKNISFDDAFGIVENARERIVQPIDDHRRPAAIGEVLAEIARHEHVAVRDRQHDDDRRDVRSGHVVVLDPDLSELYPPGAVLHRGQYHLVHGEIAPVP